MGNLIFLVGAVVLSVVGSVWLWLRSRPPTSVMSSIDGFREEMSALAGDRPSPSGRPTDRTPPPRPAARHAPPTRLDSATRDGDGADDDVADDRWRTG